jgi:hypothetical protein
LIAGLAPIELAGKLEVRKNRPSRRSDRSTFSRLFAGRSSGVVRKAPRRREVERLEGREMMAGDVTNALSALFNDPMVASQWHLLASQQHVAQPNSPAYDQTLAVTGQDINVLPAWLSGFSGSGVQIAILSGGFDLLHEDLQFRTDLDLDLVGGDNETGYEDSTDFIGTALAGIIGATANNGLGGVGVAFNADMIPVRLRDSLAETIDPTALVTAITAFAGLPVDLNGDGVVDSINQANTAEIVLHAWNYFNVAGQDRTAEDLNATVKAALETTAQLGRPFWDDVDSDGILDTSEMDSLRFLGTIRPATATVPAPTSRSSRSAVWSRRFTTPWSTAATRSVSARSITAATTRTPRLATLLRGRRSLPRR